MATLPTPEDSARIILSIFGAHNVKPGNVLMSGALNIQFLQDGRTAAECADGLGYAEKNGWLEAGPNNSIKLTDAGYAQI